MNASHPTTPSTEVKRPAIDDSPVSSMADDERTTSGSVVSVHSRSYAWRTSRATFGSSRPAPTAVVVMTNPGSVAKPADAARARFAAFAPDTEASRVSGSESATTIRGLTSITLRAAGSGVWGRWTLMVGLHRWHAEEVDTDGDSGVQVAPQRRGVRWRRVLLAAGLVLVVAMAATFLVFRRQTISYVTHRKGGPSITWPYEVHDPPADFHLAVVGDGGDGGARIDATGAAAARIAEQEPYDGLLFLGDNVYPAGDPSKLPDTVFEPFADVLAGGADLMAILGNHDVKKGRGDEQMEALGMPGRYWAKEYGDVLIVGLDSNEIDDPAQLQFLDDTLASSDATWKIVAMHHPPYSAGYQGSSRRRAQAGRADSSSATAFNSSCPATTTITSGACRSTA